MVIIMSFQIFVVAKMFLALAAVKMTRTHNVMLSTSIFRLEVFVAFVADIVIVRILHMLVKDMLAFVL